MVSSGGGGNISVLCEERCILEVVSNVFRLYVGVESERAQVVQCTLLEKCRQAGGATACLSARRYTCRARSRKRRFAAWRRTCSATRSCFCWYRRGHRGGRWRCLIARRHRVRRSRRRRCLRQCSPGQSFHGRGSPRRRFTGRCEQVLPRNITNLFEDWLHLRAVVHAVGTGVFGRNVDVEVKNCGVIPCIQLQIVG